MVFLSGENATEYTMSLCPMSVALCSPVSVSHKRTVWSLLAVAIVFPSGEYAMDEIMSACPLSVVLSCLVPISHKWIVPPLLPLAMVLLSGENAIERPASTSKVVMCSPVVTSHKRISCRFPLAIVLPSGEYTTELTPTLCPVSSSSNHPLRAS